MQPGRSGNGFIFARHFQLAYSLNNPFQLTSATKRLGVFGFRVVERGAYR